MDYNKSALNDARSFAMNVSSASSTDNAIGLLANAVQRLCDAIENKQPIPNDDSDFDQKPTVKPAKATALNAAKKTKPKRPR